MRASFFTSVLAFAASVTAQLNTQYLSQSAPFNLFLISENKTINGTSLSACREGAATKGFCLGPKNSHMPPSIKYSTYYFNYTETSTVNPTIGQVGILTYIIRGVKVVVSSPMTVTLQYKNPSNVAVPVITPSMIDVLHVVFDKNDKLAVPGDINDQQASAIGAKSPRLYYCWYVCTITILTYTYTQLAWTIGDQSPENPTCVKVDVVRVFV